MSEYRNRLIAYNAVGIIFALIGIAALAESWIDVESKHIGLLLEYTTSIERIMGSELLNLDTNDFQKYIPIVIAILSAISMIVFAIGIMGHGKKLMKIPVAMGVIVMILAIVAYLWIGGLAEIPGWESSIYWSSVEGISSGMGVYLTMISGIAAILVSVLADRCQ